MRYLGIVKREADHLVLPDGFDEVAPGQTYEAVEVGGDIILTSSPLDRQRLEEIDRLAKQSIEVHRQSLEGLSR